ncbi:hypothetical protein [Streptomyces triticisoli]|uniref:hypothetical protein n=1 Tax=Streptomyces triticisoli TaxID=2182797 RepID=UPI000DDA8651|nr:hypothetical protein [Streptomyces triticisoli]
MTTSSSGPRAGAPPLHTAREVEEATGIKAATIRVERRCAADAPAPHSRESLHAPYAQPRKWVPCPHACGHVGQPEIRPSILYGLAPQISPSATPATELPPLCGRC